MTFTVEQVMTLSDMNCLYPYKPIDNEPKLIENVLHQERIFHTLVDCALIVS